MKKVYLEGLGFEVKVPNDICYNYHGEVESCKEYALQLSRRYKFEIPPFHFPMGSECPIDKINEQHFPILGLLLPEKKRRRRYFHYHAFIKRGLNPNARILTRGHEETHFVMFTNNLDTLRKHLLADGYKRGLSLMESNRIARTEHDIADIGGVYALKRSLKIPLTDTAKWKEILSELDKKPDCDRTLSFADILHDGWVVNGENQFKEKPPYSPLDWYLEHYS